MCNFFSILIGIIICLHASMSHAQLLNKKGDEVTPYYVAFEAPSLPTVADIRGEYLHLSYRDKIGTSNSVTVSIRNSKNERIKQLTLAKEFGLNYFDIKFSDYGFSFIENEYYFCSLTNEKGQTSERTIRYLPEVKNIIAASIFVKPKNLICSDRGDNNLVEYYGEVSGGKAPYKINWFVMNKQRTGFLYQPMHAFIQDPGTTSAIQVDKAPEYFVLLYVTDACGNEQTTTVQVVCEKSKKKVNTVFFQRLDDAIGNVKNVEPIGK